MKISKITIVESDYGCDTVIMETNLPSVQYPYTGMQDLKTHVAKGRGYEWVKMHFPSTEVEIIKSDGYSTFGL